MMALGSAFQVKGSGAWLWCSMKRLIAPGALQLRSSTCGRDPPSHRRAHDEPKPFTWTKTPAQILAKLNPLNAPVY
jgi:hypothetical protein